MLQRRLDVVFNITYTVQALSQTESVAVCEAQRAGSMSARVIRVKQLARHELRRATRFSSGTSQQNDVRRTREEAVLKSMLKS